MKKLLLLSLLISASAFARTDTILKAKYIDNNGAITTMPTANTDLSAASSASFQYLDATSSIQTQLNSKQSTLSFVAPLVDTAGSVALNGLLGTDKLSLVDPTDASKSLSWLLSGQATSTSFVLAPQNTSGMTLHIPQVATASGAGMALVQDETTGFIFSNGITSSIGGSNSMMQLANASTANRAQIKLHSYFNGASIAGVSTLTSRSGTIAVNNSISAGQDYSKWTAQAAAATVGSAPISGTFAFKANSINALTVPSDFHIQLTNIAGTLADRFYLTSEGIPQFPYLALAGGYVQTDASGNLSTTAIVNASTSTSGFLTSADWNTFNGKQAALGFTPEDSANKGVMGGYASLDGSALIPLTQIPPAALERLAVVADQTARYALTTATVQNGDTVKQNDDLSLWFVIDDTNLGNAAGYAVYTATTATNVPWGGITGTLSSQTDLQAELDAKLNLSGGTMSGDLDLGANDLKNFSNLRYTNGNVLIDGVDGIGWAKNGTKRFQLNEGQLFTSGAPVLDWDIFDLIGAWTKNGQVIATEDQLATYIPRAVNDNFNPDNAGGGNTDLTRSFNFIPLQNSPNESWSIHNYQANLDPTSTGFTLGTNGQFATMFNLGFIHQGTSNVGLNQFFNLAASLGNGTDPIEVGGIQLINSAITIPANTTAKGGWQGYTFNVGEDAAAINDSSMYINAFNDQSNWQAASLPSYNSFNASPSIADIKNGSNYTAFTNTSNITNFTGNGSYTGLNVTPVITAMGSGAFNGININPTITNAGTSNVYGIYSSVSGVTGGANKYAGFFDGTVHVNGELEFTGTLNAGKIVSNSTLAISDGGGNPASNNLIISGLTAPASSTIANIDTIGLNLASLIDVGANATLTSGAFGLGLSAMAIPAVVSLGSGATVDIVNAATYALSLGSGFSGSINQMTGSRVVAIPNGTTTVNRLYGYFADMPFGSVGTNNWGVYSKDFGKNYFEGSVKIGGSDTPTAGIELDVSGDIKADTLTLSSALTVANGGTGLATLTANNVILGNGTGNPLFVAPSTSGKVLTSNGTTWTSATPANTPVAAAFTRDSFAGDNSTTGFTLTQTPAISAQVEIFLNGILQIYTTDYSISGTTLTFVTAPTIGQDIKAIYAGY